LSFVDTKTENGSPVYIRYKCNGYTGFAENPKEEYDVLVATLGINVENNFSHNYDYVYNSRNEFYARRLQTSSFNVKVEMEALAIMEENGEPVLFVAEAVPKKKK
jgi:hypothetical protein